MSFGTWSSESGIRLAALRHAEQAHGNIAATCRYHGISRQCFHTWRRRYEAEGLHGLEDRSSAPRHTTDEGGRGLCLVAELCHRWGVPPAPGGKVVRAGLDHPRTPRPSVPARPAPASLAAA
ncbi:helix-turn-helix domain-containing protein [Streptomyces griseoincarnatus]